MGLSCIISLHWCRLWLSFITSHSRDLILETQPVLCESDAGHSPDKPLEDQQDSTMSAGSAAYQAIGATKSPIINLHAESSELHIISGTGLQVGTQ
jgi:hypothetical protein